MLLIPTKSESFRRQKARSIDKRYGDMASGLQEVEKQSAPRKGLDRRTDGRALGCERVDTGQYPAASPVGLHGCGLTGTVNRVLGVALYPVDESARDQYARKVRLRKPERRQTDLGGVDLSVALLALESALRVAERLLANLSIPSDRRSGSQRRVFFADQRRFATRSCGCNPRNTAPLAVVDRGECSESPRR